MKVGPATAAAFLVIAAAVTTTACGRSSESPAPAPAAAPARSTAADIPISTDGTDPKSWGAELDGVTAAPANHEVVWENDDIRIISVTVKAGETETVHTHQRCAVLIFDQPKRVVDKDTSRAVVPDKQWLGEIQWADGAVPAAIPFVRVQPPQAPHAISNVDDKPLHLTRIEMKNGCATPPR